MRSSFRCWPVVGRMSWKTAESALNFAQGSVMDAPRSAYPSHTQPGVYEAALTATVTGTGGRRCWKHDRQSTGRPCVGLKGTVVSVAHSEQTVRVSVRTPLPVPATRLILHCLHRFGSFLNCLSWKKSCSPAVKTKSFPQSEHFKILSMKSIRVPRACLGILQYSYRQTPELASSHQPAWFVCIRQIPSPSAKRRTGRETMRYFLLETLGVRLTQAKPSG